MNKGKLDYTPNCVLPLLAKYGGSCWDLGRARAGTGLVRDLGPAARHGTASAAGCTFGAAGPPVCGEALGTAGSFSLASNGYVDCGNVLSLEHTAAFSFAAWARAPLASGTTNVLICKSQKDATNRGYCFYKRGASNALTLTLRNNNTGTLSMYVSGTTALNDDQWHHCAATYDGSGRASGIRIYVDGVRETGSTYDNLGGNTIVTTQTLCLGAFYTNTYNFNNPIAYPAVFTGVLTPEEVRMLAASRA